MSDKLAEALRDLVGLTSRLDHAEGYCCCGDSMEDHESPMFCGHMPVDVGEYYVGKSLDAARAALAAYDAAKGGAPDVQIEFLLSVAKDDEATIQRLEADLKESREYALALEKELRDRANSQPAWGPPTEEHREGFECLAENSFGIWRHVKWTNGRWMVRGTFNEIEPTDLAPLPKEADHE